MSSLAKHSKHFTNFVNARPVASEIASEIGLALIDNGVSRGNGVESFVYVPSFKLELKDCHSLCAFYYKPS